MTEHYNSPRNGISISNLEKREVDGPAPGLQASPRTQLIVALGITPLLHSFSPSPTMNFHSIHNCRGISERQTSLSSARSPEAIKTANGTVLSPGGHPGPADPAHSDRLTTPNLPLTSLKAL